MLQKQKADWKVNVIELLGSKFKLKKPRLKNMLNIFLCVCEMVGGGEETKPLFNEQWSLPNEWHFPNIGVFPLILYKAIRQQLCLIIYFITLKYKKLCFLMIPTSSIISRGKKREKQSEDDGSILSSLSKLPGVSSGIWLCPCTRSCHFMDAHSRREDSWVRDKGLLQHSRQREHQYILTSSP